MLTCECARQTRAQRVQLGAQVQEERGSGNWYVPCLVALNPVESDPSAPPSAPAVAVEPVPAPAGSRWQRLTAWPRQAGALLTVCLAFGAVLRVMVSRSILGRPNADEAVAMLMARHVADGEFRSFYWGNNYGGTLSSFVEAPFVKVFGTHILMFRAINSAHGPGVRVVGRLDRVPALRPRGRPPRRVSLLDLSAALGAHEHLGLRVLRTGNAGSRSPPPPSASARPTPTRSAGSGRSDSVWGCRSGRSRCSVASSCRLSSPGSGRHGTDR